jgi:hypothetical protein
VAHVELSLPDAFVPLLAQPDDAQPDEAQPDDAPRDGAQPDDSFSRWVSTVAAADEPCLVIDTGLKIVAASASCCALFDLGSPPAAGRPLVGETLRLVDFTAARGELTDPEIEKIPPLLAITSGRLARGLLRVQADAPRAAGATIDAVATPLFRDGLVAGSLTFFSEV